MASPSWSVRARRGELCSLWKRQQSEIPSTRCKVGLKQPSSSPVAHSASPSAHHAHPGRCPSLPWAVARSRERLRALSGGRSGAGPGAGPGQHASNPAGGAGCKGGSLGCSGLLLRPLLPRERDGTRLALTAPWGTRGRGGRRWVRAGAAAGVPGPECATGPGSCGDFSGGRLFSSECPARALCWGRLCRGEVFVARPTHSGWFARFSVL